MAERAAGFAAHELERIRILLLRHHAAAGAERVGQLEEAVLVAAEDDQVLRQPAEMHHRHRAGVEERRGEIAVRRGVDAVGDDPGEAEIARERMDVDGVARCRRSRPMPSGSASASSRAPASRSKSRRSGAACARKKCATSTGCAGRKWVNDGISASPGGRRLRGERVDHAATAALQQRNAPPQVQPQIERDLLVARSAGVQPAAGVAEPLDEQAFDEAVDVLVVAGDEGRIGPRPARGCRRASSRSARASSASARRRAQRARPRQAAGDIVFEQPPIEAERGAELERGGIGRRIEAAGPES